MIEPYIPKGQSRTHNTCLTEGSLTHYQHYYETNTHLQRKEIIIRDVTTGGSLVMNLRAVCTTDMKDEVKGG